MNADADPQILETSDLPGFSAGACLRAAREARGLGIADVAYALKLNPRQVEALEGDHFEQLPGRAFARGFLKNYARYLELDPTPLLDAVDQSAAAGAMELAPVSNAQGTMPSGDARLRPSVFPAALVALSLLVIVAAGWYFDWFQQPEIVAEDLQVVPTTAPPVLPVAPEPAPSPAPAGAEPSPAAGAAAVSNPVAEASVPPPAAPSSAPGESAEPSAATPAAGAGGAGATAAPSGAQGANLPAETQPAGQHRLVFRFSEDAWVEVRDGEGRVILSRIGKGGTSEALIGKPPFAVVIGNAGKVALEHEGKAVDLVPFTRVSVARLKVQ